MFGKNKDGTDQVSAPVSASIAGAARQQGNVPPSAESTSAIGSGITVVGEIIGDGAVKIFGRVEGEVQASSVVIYDGGEPEGNIIAQELIVGGLVKGVIHAARVKLNGTAIVEGDIFHGSLAIEENARFEGTSRRDDRLTDRSSDASANGPKATTQTITQALPQAGAIDGSIGNGSVVPAQMAHCRPVDAAFLTGFPREGSRLRPARHGHTAVSPPSSTSTCPVIDAAAGPTR